MRLRLVTVLLVPGLVFFLCAGPPRSAASDATELRITGDVTNVREGPSPRGRIAFQLKAGQVVHLITTEGDWHQVETADGRRGYVLRSLTEPVAPALPPPPASPPAMAAAPPAAPTIVVAHDEVGCVVRGEYPKLDACLTPRDAVGKAEIHFRAAATDPWYAVELAPGEPCHSVFLPKPGRDMTGFEYYVTGVDRAFTTFNRPAGAPAESFRVRVVRSERDCGALLRLARSMKKVAQPIIVAVARDPGGALLLAESALTVSALAGFSAEGVVMAQAAAAAAAGSGTAAGAGAAAGGGGAGAGTGIGMTTIVVGAGAAVAAAVAVGAGGGGSGDSNGSSGGNQGGGGGSTPPTTAPPATSLTGRWTGTYHYYGNGSGYGTSFTYDCTTNCVLDLAHSGTNLSGTGAYGDTNCAVSVPYEYRDVVPSNGEQYAVQGTASGNTITLNFPFDPCPPIALRGTYSNSRLEASGQQSCSFQGVSINLNSTLSAAR